MLSQLVHRCLARKTQVNFYIYFSGVFFLPGNIMPPTYTAIKIVFNTKKKHIKLQGNIREITKHS